MPYESSTGLTPRTAVPLAYLGWWVTGLVLWLVERQDRCIRFHAAQSLAAFGAIALVTGVLGALALASLSFLPAAFNVLVALAEGVIGFGLLLWVVSMWRAAAGDDWRIPLAARWAERLTRD